MNFIHPKIFPKNIISGVTLNTDGLSFGNASIQSDEITLKNRNLLANFLNIDFNNLVFQKQTHSNIVKIVDENYHFGESDGLITNLENKVLCVSIADCMAILIFDIETETISAVHSGWKGTKANIIGITINKMISQFNCKPQNLLFYLSPCAKVDSYEVGNEFLEFFPGYVIKKDDKLFFDNTSKILDQIKEFGVTENQIELSTDCTIKDSKYHSFRRDKENSGRMLAFIGKK